MKTLIKNGYIVFYNKIARLDVAFCDKKITEIAEYISPVGFDNIIDAKDKYIMPGAIDAHTHFAMPFGGTISSDDYESGSLAALAGGVTCYIDYAIQKRGDTLLEILNHRKELAKNKSYVDYGFHIAITDFNEDIADEFKRLKDYGVSSIKCFMVYKKEKMNVDDITLAEILRLGKENDILVNVHCEDCDLIDQRIEQFLKEGKTSNWYHYLSRDEEVETLGVKKALKIAKSVDAPIYIVHNASKDGIKAIIDAKDNGQIVYAETCPQYLYFTNEVYQSERAAQYVCSPSIKGKESRTALWEAIWTNYIDVIATDHCPFKLSEKAWGDNDFTKTPNGCDGVENLYRFVISAALKNRLSLSKAVELVSHNPAKIFNLKNKGDIEVGKDADIIILNPNGKHIYHNKDTYSNEDNSIWEDVSYKGTIEEVYVHGKLAFKDGKILISKEEGQYIKR